MQARHADAFAQSWRGPVRVTHGRADTFAEGIATRTTFDLTFTMLKSALDDVVTLEESELEDGLSAAIQLHAQPGRGGRRCGTRCRAQGATCPAEHRVVCVMSGGNADQRTLRRALA